MKTILTILLLCLIVAAACISPRPMRSPLSPVATQVVMAHPTITPYPTRVPITVIPGNLLIDPSLEGPYHSNGIHPEVNTSYAWTAWYSCQGDQSTCIPPCLPGKPGCYLPCPADCIKPNGNCATDYGCYWSRQEFNPFNFDKAPYRIHSGNMAQVIFSYGRMALGGILQTVAVAPDTLLEFTAWFQAWQCLEYGIPCDWGRLSDSPSDMHLKVGIDPTGGVDPASTNVVWSPEQEAFDRWVQFSVVARTRSNHVTVFTSGGPTFDWARKNNDYYIDDLVLVPLESTPTLTPTVTITPGPPTTTPMPGITLTCVFTPVQHVYVLLPPNYGEEWYIAVIPVIARNGWSIGVSGSDACLNTCGNRTVIAVNAEDWHCNLYPACRAPCGSLKYQPVYAQSPGDLAVLLARYPDWLREAWGLCFPLIGVP